MSTISPICFLARADAASRDYTRAWLRAEPLAAVTHSRYVSNRTERWYRMGSNLRNGGLTAAAQQRVPTGQKLIAESSDALRRFSGGKDLCNVVAIATMATSCRKPLCSI